MVRGLLRGLLLSASPDKRDEVLRQLEKRAREAQHELASLTDAGDDVLDFLAREGAPATRRAVAANIATPALTNRHLAEDGDDDVRAELAQKIGRLMPTLSKREAEHIRALTIETLERLAADQVPRVRAVLAEEIKRLDNVPHHIIQALARDAEAIVAVPIIEYSPLLSDADLMEIIAEGKVHGVLEAVARRRPLSAQVSDAVVSSLDIPAVAALLANPNAAVRDRTLDAIIDAHLPDAKRIGIKIDTEGFEMEVIAGLDRHLSRIDFLVSEASVLNRFEGSYNFSELVAALWDKGLRFYNLLGQTGLRAPRVYDCIFLQANDPAFDRLKI